MGVVKMAVFALFLSAAAIGCGGDEELGCPEDLPATCGNGTIDSGEVCDQGVDGTNGDFGTLTCASVTGNPSLVGRLQCRCCMPLSDMCIMGSGTPVGGNGG